MKIPVMFKMPDAVDSALEGAKDTLDKISKSDETAFRKVCSKFFQYGEYVMVEIDTDKGTATVLPVSK